MLFYIGVMYMTNTPVFIIEGKYGNILKSYLECIINKYYAFNFQKYYKQISPVEKAWAYNYLRDYSKEVIHLFGNKIGRILLVMKILAILSLWSGYISEGGRSPPPLGNPPSIFLEISKKIRKDKLDNDTFAKINASVVIPSRLAFDVLRINNFIKNLLLPLSKSKFIKYIYVVGNFSNDVRYLNKYPLVKLIYLDKKEDKPSRARNIGIKESILGGANVILLLDDDVILEDCNVIDRLLYYAYKARAVVSPLVASWTNTFYDLFHDYDGTLNGVYYKSKDQLLYATSCCMAIPRIIFDDRIFFDEDFSIAAGEDIEFSLRVWNKGYRILPIDDLVVYHNYGYMELRDPLQVFVSRYYRYGRGNYLLLKKHNYYYKLLSWSFYRSTYKVLKRRKYIGTKLINSTFTKLVECLGDID